MVTSCYPIVIAFIPPRRGFALEWRAVGGPRTRSGGSGYTPPPEGLPGFPDAVRVRPKTGRRGAAKRPRWKEPDGTIYEWDSRHGTLEKYDRRGNHCEEYDPITGDQLKPAISTRKVDP
ncbi:MAG: colicin E3/pyocin S6 family cytotoxin [Xanthobacteraceae bacterium]